MILLDKSTNNPTATSARDPCTPIGSIHVVSMHSDTSSTSFAKKLDLARENSCLLSLPGQENLDL